jgi:hypothetical protein
VSSLPVGIHAAQAGSWAFTIVGAAFFAGCLGWTVAHWRRPGGVLPALAMLGGLIASLEESWIDVMIKLWYPRDAPLVAFTAFGTPQPVYLHLIYPGFVGLGSYVVYRGLLRDPRGGRVWLTFLGISLLDLAFELPATAGHVFRYYGPQPLQLFQGGWPFWVAFINAAGPVVGGWLIYKLAPRMFGAQKALLALMPPLAYAGVYAATGWPTFTMLNSAVPSGIRWLAALATMGLCVGVVKVLIATLSVPELATEPAGSTRAAARSSLAAGSPAP